MIFRIALIAVFFFSGADLVRAQDAKVEVVEARGDSFHANVIRAAIKAQKAGTITRAQLVKLRVAMISPAFRAKVKELAILQMASSDSVDKIPKLGEGLDSIDWDQLLAFLEKLIPLVLDLITAILAITENDVQPLPSAILPSRNQYENLTLVA